MLSLLISRSYLEGSFLVLLFVHKTLLACCYLDQVNGVTEDWKNRNPPDLVELYKDRVRILSSIPVICLDAMLYGLFSCSSGINFCFAHARRTCRREASLCQLVIWLSPSVLLP